MDEIVFRSFLSMDEIEANFAGVDLFSALMEGLEEALEYARTQRNEVE